MDIISREQAFTLKLKRYFTGKLCKRRHNCERYTLNGGCVQCLNPKFEWGLKSGKRYQVTVDKRLAAAAAGHTKYDPKLPCKYGHNSYRYVSTNGCVECMRPKVKPELKAAIIAAKAQMTLCGFRLHSADVAAFTAMVHLYAVAKCSALTHNHIISKRKPESAGPGFAITFFNIFGEDFRDLKGMEAALISARNPEPLPLCKHSWTPDPTGPDSTALKCSLCPATSYETDKQARSRLTNN